MKNNPFPLDRRNTLYYGYARAALCEGLRYLGIGEGHNVILPAYICNVVLAPFNYLGIKVKYYDVDDGLRPDTKQIKDLIDKETKAILAVNYFGFPQEMEGIIGICKNSGLHLIEDNAHGFLSAKDNTPLGSIGDISIFSFRKTLPVPNGAALVINSTEGPYNSTVKCKTDVLGDALSLGKTVVKQVTRTTAYSRLKRILFPNKGNTNVLYREESPEEESNLEKYSVIFSGLTRLLMRTYNYEKMILSRRRSYMHMLQEIGGARPIFGNLSPGVAPYVLPLIVPERDAFIDELYRKTGIRSFPWPTLPKEVAASDNQKLKLYRNIVCVPVAGHR